MICRQPVHVAHEPARERPAATLHDQLQPFCRAPARANVFIVAAEDSRRSNSIGSRSICPASIFEKSRMSLMIVSSAVRRRLCHLEVLALHRLQIRVERPAPSSRGSPFIGVRISWLMFARNSLLARFAASATSFASRRCSV